jgi:hypothetical protein
MTPTEPSDEELVNETVRTAQNWAEVVKSGVDQRNRVAQLRREEFRIVRTALLQRLAELREKAWRYDDLNK